MGSAHAEFLIRYGKVLRRMFSGTRKVDEGIFLIDFCLILTIIDLKIWQNFFKIRDKKDLQFAIKYGIIVKLDMR